MSLVNKAMGDSSIFDSAVGTQHNELSVPENNAENSSVAKSDDSSEKSVECILGAIYLSDS